MKLTFKRWKLALFGLLIVLVSLFLDEIRDIGRVYQNQFWRLKYTLLDHGSTLNYKRVDGHDLKATIFYPSQIKEKYPTIIYFFGGSWRKGSINQFYSHAKHFSQLGFVSILVDYRVKLRHNSTPTDAVADIQTFMDFVYQNHHNCHIDTSSLFLCGASAGGQLALSTLFTNDSLRLIPKGVILYTPVVKTKITEISPIEHVRKGLPPTLIFFAEYDSIVDPKTILDFSRTSLGLGNKVELYKLENQGHTFPEGDAFQFTLEKSEKFVHNQLQ